LDSLRVALEDRRRRVREKVEPRLRQQLADEARARAERRRERLAFLERMEARLTRDIEALRVESGGLTRATVDLASLQQGIDLAEQVLKRVAEQVEEMKVEHGAPSRVVFLESRIVRKAK
jgi:hypothetical protein